MPAQGERDRVAVGDVTQRGREAALLGQVRSERTKGQRSRKPPGVPVTLCWKCPG